MRLAFGWDGFGGAAAVAPDQGKEQEEKRHEKDDGREMESAIGL
jgi:hypothetical protein